MKTTQNPRVANDATIHIIIQDYSSVIYTTKLHTISTYKVNPSNKPPSFLQYTHKPPSIKHNCPVILSPPLIKLITFIFKLAHRFLTYVVVVVVTIYKLRLGPTHRAISIIYSLGLSVRYRTAVAIYNTICIF